MSKERKKQYIVRKYVMATSPTDALRKEKHCRAEEVWVDENWLKENPEIGQKIGFKTKGK